MLTFSVGFGPKVLRIRGKETEYCLGLLPFGGPAGAALLDLGGTRVALTAHDLEHGVPADLAADLARARGGADVLVATFHVTGPASVLPLRSSTPLSVAV